jgi:hypothetical protein
MKNMDGKILIIKEKRQIGGNNNAPQQQAA